MGWYRYDSDRLGWGREFFGNSQLEVYESSRNLTEKARRLAQEYALSPAIESALHSLATTDGKTSSIQTIAASGWPWRCLWFRAQASDDFSPRTIAADDPAIVISSSSTPGRTRVTALPLRPLWLGLIGDTLLFSAAWLLLLSLPAMFRCSRSRRGRCVKCGYLLKGIDSAKCPECGHSVAR